MGLKEGGGRRAGGYELGSASRSALVPAPPARVWAAVSRVSDMGWAAGVRRSAPLPGPRSGVGAGRRIWFEGGGRADERVVGWRPGESLSYVATAGLPPDAYHASISLAPARGGTRVEWRSHFAGRGAAFRGFAASVGGFYGESLERLGSRLRRAPGSS